MKIEDEAHVILGMGLIGNAIYKRLSKTCSDYRIFAFDRSRIDITDREQVRPMLEYIKPTVLFLCAGMSDPKKCEREKKHAFELNWDATRVVAEECRKTHTKLIFFSTALVYNNKRKTSCSSERNKTSPINVLGQTKLEGEQVVRSNITNHLILRLGELFSEEGNNLLKNIIETKRNNVNFQVYSNQEQISPLYVPDMTFAVMSLLKKNAIGTYNLANTGHVKMSSFLTTGAKMAGMELNVKPIPPEMDDIIVPRPQNMSLCTKKYAEMVGSPFRSWEDALVECIKKMGRFSSGKGEFNK